MNSTEISATHMSEDMGRLPEATISWPISATRFHALAEFWKKQGVTLWMMNEKHESPIVRDSMPPFWQHVMSAAQSEITAIASKSADHAAHCAWREAFSLISVPIIQKRRRLGVLVGLVVHNTSGEGFARCCDQWKLDRKALASMASSLIHAETHASKMITEMIDHDVKQAVEWDLQFHSISSLTQNLENTYEELGLVYRISREMNVLREPADSIKKIGDEIMQVCRAQSIVFLLGNSENDAGGDGVDLHRRPVVCGTALSSQDDYIRLASAVERSLDKFANHLLSNNACRRPEFSWASSWLRHLAALPIQQGERRLALMLALNCRDNGDFTSIDVQLLRTIGDRIASFLENQRLYQDLASLFMGLLHSLINSVDAKDPYTCGHSERVAHFSRLLGREAGLKANECERVYLAGLLHDVGKIGIPDAILSKPGKLTDEEFTILQQHPQIGAHIVDHIRPIHDLIPAVLHHHERMDGRGYPRGLAGDEIPLLGRIVCLADCFDAMTTNRTYRTAMPVESAIAEIRRCAGTQFDPRLAELFLDMDLPAIFADARQLSGFGRNESQRGTLHVTMSTAMLTTLDSLPRRITRRVARGATCLPQ